MKIARKNIQDLFALTPLQEGMLFHYLKDPEKDLYFEQLSLKIKGFLDMESFEKAWNIVIDTNDMLRTVFRWEKIPGPVQVVLKKHKLQVDYFDFSDRSSKEKKKLVEEIKRRDRNNKFNLQHVPFRVILCKIGEEEYQLIISNHHIIYDGWSNGIILREFFTGYSELVVGDTAVPPVKTKFKEFVKWILTRDMKSQERFWQGYLDGFDTRTELSVKKKRRNSGELKEPGNYKARFSNEMKTGLENYAKEHMITLAALFYSALGILLQRYNNCEDVIFGTTVSGRTAKIEGMEEMVGLFINTLPLRVQANPHSREKIKDLIDRTEEDLQQRAEYESTSLVRIKEYSGLDHNQELFDVIAAIENYPLSRRLIQKNDKLPLSIHSYSMIERTNYDLAIGIVISEDIEICFGYNKNCFTRAIINNLFNHFANIIREFLYEPGKKIADIELLSEKEKEQILFEFNDTQTGYPAHQTIHELFEARAARTPDRIAVVGPASGIRELGSGDYYVSVSFSHLNEKSDRLAQLLRAKSAGPDTIIGIMMERSQEMIHGLLAILKAGGAYLPVSPGTPEMRLVNMLEDCDAILLLTKQEIRTADFEGEILLLDLLNLPTRVIDTLTPVNHPGNLAYIIYTSGSTGKPKGVMAEHRNVVNVVSWFARQYDIRPGSHVLQSSDYTFDASVNQIFGTLLYGGTLFLIDESSLPDFHWIRKYIDKNHIHIVNFVPMMLNGWLCDGNNREKLGSIRAVLSGGERLDDSLKDRLLDMGYELFNQYGPTETAIDALAEKCSIQPVTLGKPIANVQCYILGKDNNILPMEVPGELCIGGHGVTRGYLNNPQLTREKFVENPFVKGERIYKTGDLARLTGGRKIELLGRIDNQVKIRGFRIEPGEIENQLLEIEDIIKAIVIDKKDKNGENYLCAYIVSGKEIEISEIRNHLSKKLPDYMIPGYFVRLDKIPLTPNGKLDRKALPVPQEEISTESKYVPPRDRIEKILEEIWREVLDITTAASLRGIGIDDSFFRIGGHSLKAMNMMSLIHKKLNVKIPLAQIFKTPTIRAIAQYMANAAQYRYLSIKAGEEKEYYILSSAQKRLYYLQQMDLNNTSYNAPNIITLEGDIDNKKLGATFKQLIARHESLRTGFDMIEAVPVQRVYKSSEVEFNIEYYPDTSSETHHLSFIIHHSFIRPFDLSQPPLIRVGLIKSGEKKQILLLDMHHIITDGTSQDILTLEFIKLYAGEELPPLRVRYVDYSENQYQWFPPGEMKKKEQYWLKQFEGEVPVLDLPTDYPRPPVESFEGDSLYFEIEEELTHDLKKFASGTGTTLFMVLLAAFNVLLSKYSLQEDIVVGSPVTGRTHADLNDVIGMFVNMLALRNYPGSTKSYREFLAEVKKNAVNAFENQDYQFDSLVAKLNLQSDVSRHPLVDTVFVFQNIDRHYRRDSVIKTPGLILEPSEIKFKITKFDLELSAGETGNKIWCNFDYRTKLFKNETIEKMSRHLLKVIRQTVSHPGIKISGINLVSKEEMEEIKKNINSNNYTGKTMETPQNHRIPAADFNF